MSTWAVVLLGIVALGSLVQSAFLIGLALSGLKLSKRLSALQEEITGEIAPALKDLERVQENLGEASARLGEQTERVQQVVVDLSDRIDEARTALLPIAGKVVTLIAAVKGIRRGLRMFRDLRRAAD